MKWNQVLWEFPQSMLGWVISHFITVKTLYGYADRIVTIFNQDNWFSKIFSGTSLGEYIFLPENNCAEITVKHEYGHCLQSKKWGWLYLLAIGLPSIANNLWDRNMHKSWNYTDRVKWYYNRYPEKEADALGGIEWINGARVNNGC